MIGRKMEKAINGQINKELYSAYLYLAMSAYSQGLGLKGFANWFRVQYGEELGHALKFVDYLHEHGNEVVLEAIEKPPAAFKSPASLFEQALKHEQFVTRSIHGLVDLAAKERDHATQSFLKWYVDEQVEEESQAAEILGRIRMAGGAGSPGLLFVDRELAARKAD